MSSIFSSVFSNEEIDYLLQLPEVVAAKDRFGSSNKVQFTIPLTDGIRAALQTRFGLDLSSVSEIPMRWIKGDTAAHRDRGSRSFENTYLVYVNDSEGEFVLGTDSYPINANTGFVFKEGTMHKTLNTGLTPRLLIGPMNEFAGPVGDSNGIYYYTNYYDANAGTNLLASSGSYVINDAENPPNNSTSPYTQWRVARTTNGTADPLAEAQYADNYDLGFNHGTGFTYHIYPSSQVLYYSNSANAIARNGTTILSYATSYTLGSSLIYGGSLSSYTSWRIAFVTNNSAPFPTTTFVNADQIATLTGLGGSEMYYVYQSPVICFLEGTQILCLKDDVETYVPIETMRTGLLVKTSRDGYKKVILIGKSTIRNLGTNERIGDRLYKLSPSAYPDLKENLFITGGHSTLVDNISDKEREGITKHLGLICITDQKYRLTALVDERAEPWLSEGTYTIWHFALEHSNILMNYGVYANGLLVETCSINTMLTKSNLSIV